MTRKTLIFRISKAALILLEVIVAAIFLYWIKCQAGIDLVKSWHVGDYLPVQALQGHERDVFYARASVPPVIIQDGFQVQFFVHDPWGRLWMREGGKVHRAFMKAGADGSRCLVVKSQSPQDWAYESDILVEVLPGDMFSFEGMARTTGNADARMSVVLYDPAKKVVDWNYALKRFSGKDWTRVSSRFMIPDRIRYIRLRLTGFGIGQVYFDNIRFRREKKTE